MQSKILVMSIWIIYYSCHIVGIESVDIAIATNYRNNGNGRFGDKCYAPGGSAIPSESNKKYSNAISIIRCPHMDLV